MILARIHKLHKLLQYRSRRVALAVAGDRKRQAKEQVWTWAARSPETSPQSLSAEDLFSGFICIDLNAIAGGNMRVRKHLEFDEPV